MKKYRINVPENGEWITPWCVNTKEEAERKAYLCGVTYEEVEYTPEMHQEYLKNIDRFFMERK